MLSYTHYVTVWTSTWKRNLLGVIKHRNDMQFRKLLELKTVERLGESAGNMPYVLVLFLDFPTDPLGTQNIGPGEPLV